MGLESIRGSLPAAGSNEVRSGSHELRFHYGFERRELLLHHHHFPIFKFVFLEVSLESGCVRMRREGAASKEI
jgi:hypothetical protein